MQGNTLNLHTPLTSGVGLKGQILKLCRFKYILFIKQSTKAYLTGVCYYLNDQKSLKAVFLIAIFCQAIVAYPV